MQKISQTSFPQGDVSGKYWSFRRRGGLSPDRDCSNPTVRRQISGSTTDLRPSGLRRQFQVDVSLFLIFFVFFLYVRHAPGFLRPMDKGRARAVGELVACYLRAVSLCAPGEASVLVSSAPKRSGQKAPQISSPRVLAVDRGANTR